MILIDTIRNGSPSLHVYPRGKRSWARRCSRPSEIVIPHGTQWSRWVFLKVLPTIGSACLCLAANNRYRVLIVHGDFLFEDGWLIWHFDLHPGFLFGLQLLLPGLLVLLALVLLLDLPLQRLLDRVLVLLLLLHHYRLLVPPLEDRPPRLQLQVSTVLKDLATGHNSREVALGLH